MPTKTEMTFYSQLLGAVSAVFDKDSEHYIDGKLINDNPELFFYVLAGMVPCNLYNKFTNSQQDVLEHNQTINTLIFQFSNKGDNTREP